MKTHKIVHYVPSSPKFSQEHVKLLFLPSNFLSSNEKSCSRMTRGSYSEAVYEYSPKTFKEDGLIQVLNEVKYTYLT